MSCVQFELNLIYLRENRFETKLKYCKVDYFPLLSTKYFRNEKFSSFRWSNVEASVFKDEYANDPGTQFDLLSGYFASIIKTSRTRNAPNCTYGHD